MGIKCYKLQAHSGGHLKFAIEDRSGESILMSRKARMKHKRGGRCEGGSLVVEQGAVCGGREQGGRVLP